MEMTGIETYHLDAEAQMFVEREPKISMGIFVLMHRTHTVAL